MIWYRYRQVPGRQNRLPLADSGGAHVFKNAHCSQIWALLNWIFIQAVPGYFCELPVLLKYY